MPRGLKVPITPSVLGWAITESGISPEEVAHRLDVSVDELKGWTTGRSLPLLTGFRRLAQILKRPSAVFLLPEPPKVAGPHVEFRHPPGIDRDTLNPSELKFIRESFRIQRMLSWVLSELGDVVEPLPRVSSVDATVETAATTMRIRLGVQVQDQLKWGSSAEAQRGWRTALQNIGILTFQLPLGGKSCRGFSLWDERAPLIAINTHWNYEARMFSLFHELGHLLTRTSSACVDVGRKHPHSDDLERWCEAFAAALLLPWDEMKRLMTVRLGWREGQKVTDLASVTAIARKFRTSLRATTLRLIEHGVANWNLYGQIPVVADHKDGGGGGEGRRRRQIMLDEYGQRTADLFVRAMNKDILDRHTVLDHLDIPDSDLDRVAVSRQTA